MKVTWDESVCVHAGKCVGGAPNVFKIVDGNFVIDTSADSEEKITAVVSECPSGALKIEE
ncbi:MAG: (4Fe-4S)-binding protein [Pseudomonadota bacterium]|nr:(4Fe-4S)-binding protein [Pseudomonadota bacterium]|tara:strand:- start:111 stop:290 length:180 start_codon:yes stop_codon:yes gene_type:complete